VKNRSRAPPNPAKPSKWFVCYGCKSYCLCSKCAVNDAYFYTRFQEHARQCDPYYEERFIQIQPVRKPQPLVLPPQELNRDQTYPPFPSFPPPLEKQSLPQVQDQPIAMNVEEDEEESSEDSNEILSRLSVQLPAGASNLLSFYTPPVYYESTYKGCWTGDSLIFKWDGSEVSASDIIPGDKLLSSVGTCSVVNAVIISLVNCDVKIVALNPQCKVTRGHPVYNNSTGEYMRADAFNIPIVQKVDKLYNFELQQDCVGLMCSGGVISAGVGKSFDKVKEFSKENDLLWGDNYWSNTRKLLQNNHFKNITYWINPTVPIAISGSI
jgi:hypothetical protein